MRTRLQDDEGHTARADWASSAEPVWETLSVFTLFCSHSEETKLLFFLLGHVVGCPVFEDSSYGVKKIP